MLVSSSYLQGKDVNYGQGRLPKMAYYVDVNVNCI